MQKESNKIKISVAADVGVYGLLGLVVVIREIRRKKQDI